MLIFMAWLHVILYGLLICFSLLMAHEMTIVTYFALIMFITWQVALFLNLNK